MKPRYLRAVRRMDQLFEIDHGAGRSAALPKSVLAKACNYTLTLWTRLTRFLEYPDLELSSNCVENANCPIALGRSNWIHLGSEEAGPRVAALVCFPPAKAS